MTYYNTKFGGPTSISIKDMLRTMFSVKTLETSLHQLENNFDVRNLLAIF